GSPRLHSGWPYSIALLVRSIFVRTFSRLLFSPLRDFAVIAAQQDFRNLPATRLRGACVLRCLQQTFTKTVVVGGLFIAENALDQTDNRINENDSCDCTIRQHIIADRYFLIDQIFNYSMVNAFIMATDDDEIQFL